MKVLAKYHSGLDVTQTAPNDYDFTAVGLTRVGCNMGWTKLSGQLFISENYFDLKGLAIDDKTIFPTGITCQRGSSPKLDGAAAGDNFIMLDVITSIPIDTSDVQTVFNWINVGAGFPGSTLNYEHVLYMRGQRWTVDVDTNAQFPLKADEYQAGSLSPTASDRLYSYRVVLINLNNASTQIVTPSGRHVMQLDTKEEPTYEYMMRLKRSYDLQQSSDVD